MTEQEKMIKHIEKLIETFNYLYKEYRLTIVQNENTKKRLCQALKGCAFGLAQDFNELERLEMFDEQPKTNDAEIR